MVSQASKAPVTRERVSHSVVSDSLRAHGLCLWNSLGKNTEVGCHSLLQGIFPTQGLNPESLVLQADSLPFEPPGKTELTS